MARQRVTDGKRNEYGWNENGGRRENAGMWTSEELGRQERREDRRKQRRSIR